METAFDKVTAALSAHGSSCRRDMWVCPSHDDHDPSLRVTQKNDRVLLVCHTCSAEEIVGALGLSMSDLFDKVDPRPVADYFYRDANDTVLFKKTRIEPGLDGKPKTFRIYHPDGDNWEEGKGDVKPVLYRLPELKKAIADGEIVYVVEGEKDVDTLAAQGIAGTCNYEGAGKWLDEYSSHFSDAHVIVIADRDEPGYQHAKRVRDSLHGIAKSVRVVQSAVDRPKADVTDHFQAGYKIDELVPLHRAFRPVHLGSLVSSGVKAPEFIGPEKLLYRGGLHCIAGAPDCGKTTLALYWAVSLLAAGQRVAFFDEEGGQEIIAEKLISLGASPLDMENLIYVPFPGKMWDDPDIDSLLEFIEESQPDMVLWDSSAAFLARAGLDENSAPAVTNWWSRVLMPLARDLNAAVLVIDHDTKSSESSRYARGSGAKLAVLDVQFKVEIVTPFSRVQSGELKFHVSKDRRGWLYRDWRVKMDSQQETLAPQFVKASCDQETWNTWSTTKQDVYAVMPSGAWISVLQIIDKVRKSCGRTHARPTVQNMLTELREEGFVEQQETMPGERSWWRRK